MRAESSAACSVADCRSRLLREGSPRSPRRRLADAPSAPQMLHHWELTPSHRPQVHDHGRKYTDTGGFAELREIFSELRFSDSSTTCGAGARGLGKITSGRAQPASRGSSRHFDSAPTIQSQSHVLVNERLPHFIPESTGYNRIEGSTSLTIGLQRLHRGKKTFLTA